jgi:hypothetical protein
MHVQREVHKIIHPVQSVQWDTIALMARLKHLALLVNMVMLWVIQLTLNVRIAYKDFIVLKELQANQQMICYVIKVITAQPARTHTSQIPA